MHNAAALFRANLAQIRELEGLHKYLSDTIVTPISFDDILRFQLVYGISAFDKLIHDLIREGMIEIYAGKRPHTAKYLAEGISLDMHHQLLMATSSSLPPPELILKQTLFNKFKIFAFQDPAKVVDGLSYIWDEKHKWKTISTTMGIDENTAKTTLKLIVDRRNSIVHEADIDPSTNLKFTINQTDCTITTNFLEKCGLTIANLVI